MSCTSASACTAVGYANGAGVSTTLGERWNGTSWSIQSTPNPTGATYSFLSGVSCPSATDCTAVGFYVNSTGTQETLAERWNGTTWSIQTTPNPSGALSSGLNGVSCASSATCTAVGTFFENVGMGRTLAERWNGQSWAVQNTKDPTSAQQSFLNGVSCTSASVCTAVGTYETTTGTSLTLVERFS